MSFLRHLCLGSLLRMTHNGSVYEKLRVNMRNFFVLVLTLKIQKDL